MSNRLLSFAVAAGLAASSTSALFAQEEKSGYHGTSRTMLWSTSDIPFVDTTKYKKDGKFVISHNLDAAGRLLHARADAIARGELPPSALEGMG